MSAAAEAEAIHMHEGQNEGKPAETPTAAGKPQNPSRRGKGNAPVTVQTVVQEPRAPVLRYSRVYNAGLYETETFTLEYPLKAHDDEAGIMSFFELVADFKLGARSVRDIPEPRANGNGHQAPPTPPAAAAAGTDREVIPARELYRNAPKQAPRALGKYAAAEDASEKQMRFIRRICAHLGCPEPAGPLTKLEASQWIEENNPFRQDAGRGRGGGA